MKNEAKACIVCGHSSFTTPFDNGKFAVRMCISCKYGIVDPVPTGEELTDLYNSSLYFATHMDYDYQRINEEAIERLISQNKHLHVDNLAKYLKSSHTLLEIGPGGGFALKAFQRMGLQVTGLETSTASCEFATEKLDVPMINSGLESFTPDRTYDVVMLNHVLEHFVDLPGSICKLNALCASEGILYVRVPDHDSYDRKKYGSAWPAYLPFHISYFSEKSLLYLLKAHGFTVLEVKKYVSEQFLRTAPDLVRRLVKRIIVSLNLTDLFSGRTITVIARKTA